MITGSVVGSTVGRFVTIVSGVDPVYSLGGWDCLQYFVQ